MNIGYLYLLLATLFFSSMEVVLKTVAHDFHPVQLNCTRFLIGGLLIIPFALRAMKKRNVTLDTTAFRKLALLAFLGLVVSMLLYQFSILYAPASVVSVLFSCNPILVIAFAAVILRTTILPQHIIALAMELAGALVIIDPLHITLDPVGVMLVLASAAMFALYIVLGKKLCAQYSGLAVTCVCCLMGSAEMLLIIGLGNIPFLSELLKDVGLPMFANIPFFSGYSLDNILPFLYICIFVTAGGYACHFMAVEATSPMQGSLVFFFKPVLAPILAMIVLDEIIPWNMWMGITLILIASLISMLPSLRIHHSVTKLLTSFPQHFPRRKP